MKTVVIGSGSWGSALAQVLQDKEEDVIIYGLDEAEIKDINEHHQNRKYFPDVTLNSKLRATTDISVVKDADVIVLSVPSIAIEAVCTQVSELIDHPVIIVNTAKGFHPKTNGRMSEVIRSVMPQRSLFDRSISCGRSCDQNADNDLCRISKRRRCRNNSAFVFQPIFTCLSRK